MTELSFLVSLLLDHKLPKVTQQAVAERIKEVEGKLALAPTMYSAKPYSVQPTPVSIPPHLVGQPASTIAAMMRHEAQGHPQMQVPPPRPDEQAIIDAQAQHPQPPPQPVAQIAQTPAAQAALAERNQVIAAATFGGPFTGKPGPGRTAPRKY